MKNLIIILLLIPLVSLGQEPTKTICYKIDDFTDEKSLDAGGEIFYTDGGDMSS